MIQKFDSFDPDIPDGLQVEVFDYDPLPADDARRLHNMVEGGNRLWAATRVLDARHRPIIDGPMLGVAE